MSTSGSTNYSQTRDQIISDSLQLLGVIGSGQTANSNDVTFCSNMLNKMVKSWQAQGINLWKETSGTIALVSGTYTYTLNASNYPSIGRPLNIINCRYQYSTGLERKMKKLGHGEYDEIATKTTSSGPSTAWYYSPQLTSGILYVWPVPDSSSDSLAITYIKTIEDFDNSSDDPDFPVEWLEALTYNLAVKVAPAFGLTLSKANPDIIMTANQALGEMLSWDSEEGSVRIVPNNRYGS